MFITDERVAVTHPEVPGHTIYIRGKLDFGRKSRLIDSSVTLKQGKQRVTPDSDPDATDAGALAERGMLPGTYQRVLLEESILGWEGPQFEGFPCTPENIQRLDPDDPLVKAALAETARRNVGKSTGPKGSERMSAG